MKSFRLVGFTSLVLAALVLGACAQPAPTAASTAIPPESSSEDPAEPTAVPMEEDTLKMGFTASQTGH